jgi:hypothetical protein
MTFEMTSRIDGNPRLEQRAKAGALRKQGLTIPLSFKWIGYLASDAGKFILIHVEKAKRKPCSAVSVTPEIDGDDPDGCGVGSSLSQVVVR